MLNTNISESLLFPLAITEWSKLVNNIRNSEPISAFKRQILKFTWRIPNITFNVHKPYGIKLLTTLRVGLSNFCVSTSLETIFKTS